MTNSTRRNILKLPVLAAAPYIARAENAVDPSALASMLMVGFHGQNANANGAQTLAKHIATNRVGGVCFLGHNTKSKAGIESLTNLFIRAAKHTIPLLAVDQEGGAVQRLNPRSGYVSYPRAQTVAKKHNPVEAAGLYRKLALEMKHAGFNLNLAPVVDLGVEPANPVVFKWGRTYGADSEVVAKYAGAFVRAHRDVNMLTALKHFPGHGSTVVDSHAKPVDLTSTWHRSELTPFEILTANDAVDIVMSGHLIHHELTGSLPATLSPLAIKLLRDEIGFRGVAMTDDLDMKAIRSSYSLMQAIVYAIRAGYDLILVSNSLEPDNMLPQKIFAAVKDAVRDGTISADSISESAERIKNLKAPLTV